MSWPWQAGHGQRSCLIRAIDGSGRLAQGGTRRQDASDSIIVVAMPTPKPNPLPNWVPNPLPHPLALLIVFDPKLATDADLASIVERLKAAANLPSRDRDEADPVEDEAS